MTPFVHIHKNQEPGGRWVVTIVTELCPEEEGTSTVLSQTNLFFDEEPQVQHIDWT
jgi:hypothetical protein